LTLSASRFHSQLTLGFIIPSCGKGSAATGSSSIPFSKTPNEYWGPALGPFPVVDRRGVNTDDSVGETEIWYVSDCSFIWFGFKAPCVFPKSPTLWFGIELEVIILKFPDIDSLYWFDNERLILHKPLVLSILWSDEQ